MNDNNMVNRDEFALYDLIKTLSFLGVMMSMAIVHMGCHGLKSIKMSAKKPKFAKQAFRRSMFRIALMAVLALIVHHHVKEVKDVIMHNKQQKSH